MVEPTALQEPLDCIFVWWQVVVWPGKLGDHLISGGRTKCLHEEMCTVCQQIYDFKFRSLWEELNRIWIILYIYISLCWGLLSVLMNLPSAPAVHCICLRCQYVKSRWYFIPAKHQHISNAIVNVIVQRTFSRYIFSIRLHRYNKSWVQKQTVKLLLIFSILLHRHSQSKRRIIIFYYFLFNCRL